MRSLSERLQQLGLECCPVCNSTQLEVDRRPAIVQLGAIEPLGQASSPDADIVYALRVVCTLCGHMLLFDSEQHHHGDEPVLIEGPDELDPDE